MTLYRITWLDDYGTKLESQGIYSSTLTTGAAAVYVPASAVAFEGENIALSLSLQPLTLGTYVNLTLYDQKAEAPSTLRTASDPSLGPSSDLGSPSSPAEPPATATADADSVRKPARRANRSVFAEPDSL